MLADDVTPSFPIIGIAQLSTIDDFLQRITMTKINSLSVFKQSSIPRILSSAPSFDVLVFILFLIITKIHISLVFV